MFWWNLTLRPAARVTSQVFPYFPFSVVPWTLAVALGALYVLYSLLASFCLLTRLSIPACISYRGSRNLVSVAPLLRMYLSATLLVYFIFASRLINELCEILHIRAFHIVPNPPKQHGK